MKTGIGTLSGSIGDTRRLFAVTGQSSASHYAELIQENITTSRFVPAGVMAANRSQEYGYSLLYAG